MRKKHYIHSLSFFMTDKMYSTIKRITDEREIGFSDLMREAVEQYLEKVAGSEEVQHG